MIYFLLIPLILSIVIISSFVYLYKKGQAKQIEFQEEQIEGLNNGLHENYRKLEEEGLRGSQIETLVQFRRENDVSIYHFAFFGRKKQDEAQMKRITYLIDQRVKLEDKVADILRASAI